MKLALIDKSKIIIFLVFSSAFLLAFFVGWYGRGKFIFEEKGQNPINKIIPKPLESYTIENLSSQTYPGGQLEIKEDTEEKDKFTSKIFSLDFQPNPGKKESKTTTGVINMPKIEEKMPLVVMIRGYVDPEIYKPGIGTNRAAEYFANNGYITIAPDFLGYANSSENSGDIFESRFQTYTTVLSLINSLEQINEWDKKNLYIWSHSNGGQIALTVLEITGQTIPTSLWAPVSKPFPYSILYYTDESSDRGKLIRKELAKFEELYDVDKYSLDLYLDRIKAPIQLHQGTNDDAIPKEWSDILSEELKDGELDVNYFVYSGSDHNLQPAWETVVQRDLEFFRKYYLQD